MCAQEALHYEQYFMTILDTQEKDHGHRDKQRLLEVSLKGASSYII